MVGIVRISLGTWQIIDKIDKAIANDIKLEWTTLSYYMKKLQLEWDRLDKYEHISTSNAEQLSIADMKNNIIEVYIKRIEELMSKTGKLSFSTLTSRLKRLNKTFTEE